MAAPAPSLGRKLLFSAIVTAIVLFLFAGSLELILRAINYGHSPHFARRATLPSGEAVWRENRWCTAPYFSPQLVRRPQPFRLPAKKAPNTYRIFVLGSSAAMGDPEPSFSFARVLESMLRAAYPDLHFEIVNAAITAINSHVVRGIADDCARLEPDLFVIYEGHNEVIGPFGPAGVFTPFLRSPAAIRFAAALKTSRSGQLTTALTRRISDDKPLTEWRGMQMFLGQQIAFDDARLGAVRENFRANLRHIATTATDAGARTFLCTVVTNQRDFAPFLSLHRRDLSPESLLRWKQHFESAQAAERTNDLATAESNYRAALAIDDHHAELHFRLGRLLLRLERPADARGQLQRALDFDALRFRTDSALNQIIRDLATEPLPNVELVDLASSLAQRSEAGLPGDDFLYEHVHLTFRGAYEIARDLFAHISTDLARRQLISSAAREPFSYDEARIRLAYTTHEQAMIALELVNRFRSPPFTAQIDHHYRLQTWQRRAESANTLLARPEALPALHALYQRAIAAVPDDWILARNAGSLLVTRRAPADALPLLERAAAWIDDDPDTLLALAWAHRALDHPDRAETFFNRARALEPHYPGLPQ